MHRILRMLRDFLFGRPKLPALEEETYPRDAAGRPDLKRFTRPLAHYTGYIDEYLVSLGTSGPTDPAWQSFAYRKSVLGQWGIIARGPSQALPYVLRLLTNPIPEGRSAAAGILDAWAADITLVPRLIGALENEDDIETLSILAGTLGRLGARAALPRLAELLRSPNSDHGDLSGSMIEAVSAIAREDFTADADPKRAADQWLREQGY
ncbi:MAG: HEAT repeat domain-containing protein [Gemmatimonadota bacterium]